MLPFAGRCNSSIDCKIQILSSRCIHTQYGNVMHGGKQQAEQINADDARGSHACVAVCRVCMDKQGSPTGLRYTGYTWGRATNKCLTWRKTQMRLHADQLLIRDQVQTLDASNRLGARRHIYTPLRASKLSKRTDQTVRKMNNCKCRPDTGIHKRH